MPKWREALQRVQEGRRLVPPEIRIYDEIDKANSTIVVIKSVDLHSLPENMFTKAWLESKSR